MGTGAFLLQSTTSPLSPSNSLHTIVLGGDSPIDNISTSTGTISTSTISTGNTSNTSTGNIAHAYELPIVCAGSLVSWLRDKLQLIETFAELNVTFLPASPADSVVFVPHLAGCLFPQWNPATRGSFHNLTLATDRSAMLCAVLEAVAFSVREALESLPTPVSVLSVDGGMCANPAFIQLLADICQLPLRKEASHLHGSPPFVGVLHTSDATCLGAILLASNFTTAIPDCAEIITPRCEHASAYSVKYRQWQSFQRQ